MEGLFSELSQQYRLSPVSFIQNLFKKQYAIPQEKGAWIWWIGPLLIGIVAAGRVTFNLIPLSIAALISFLLRHPLTLLVKTLCGRRNRRNLAPVCVWLTLYSLVLLTCFGWLLLRGHTWVLGLTALVAPIIIWHEWLVIRCEERHQPILDIAAAAIAASTAPAAYWVCQGPESATPWFLWFFSGLQASASIVHMFLRLRQRVLMQLPPMATRWRMGAFPLAHHACNSLVSVWMFLMNGVSGWLVVAFGVAMAEGLFAVVRPQINAPPREPGMRQLGISTIFFLLMMIAHV